MSLALPMLHDRDRVNIVEAGRLHHAVSFSRASTATYMGSSGSLVTAAVNVPRYEYTSGGVYLGLLIEEARTNNVLNSATLVTQTRTVTAVAQTLSFYGTGTVTLSGVATGTLVGTGASNRVTLTFTPTAGSLTLTVSGSCTNGQLEAGAFATSYIPTTGAAVTRSADVATVTTLSQIGFNVTAGSMVGAWDVPAFSAANGNPLFQVDDTTTLNRVLVYFGVGSPAIARLFVAVSNITQASIISLNPGVAGTPYRTASAWATSSFAQSTNGGTVVTASSGALPTVTQIRIGAVNSAIFLNGHIKSLTYYPRRLPNSELQRLTA